MTWPALLLVFPFLSFSGLLFSSGKKHKKVGFTFTVTIVNWYSHGNYQYINFYFLFFENYVHMKQKMMKKIEDDHVWPYKAFKEKS